jgi:predicted RND superfamily exporter protein
LERKHNLNILAKGIIKHKRLIVIVFVVITAIAAILSLGVGTNYKLADYLPEDAKSTIALEIMEEEFDSGIPNATVMISNIGIDNAFEYKNKLENIEGITEVTWLDDIVDLKKPIEVEDKSLVETYYKDNNALFSIVIDENYDKEVISSVYELIGDESEGNAFTGTAVSNERQKRMTEDETMKAMMYLLPVIIIALILSTSSWLEPLLFLITIGVAVLINMGTNIIFGEVSFVTNSVSPILQLAVSLDYAIFLLHSFERNRKENKPEEAMKLAIKGSFSAIIASAATTLFGFAALSFMEFEIGADLGLNLVKGIFFSFITVIVLLPAITLYMYKVIDKTRHKQIFPKFNGFSDKVSNLKAPVLLIMLLIIIPCFLAQSSNTFLYGSEALEEGTRISNDEEIIEDTFGRNTPMVLLVPNVEPVKEKLLVDVLESEHSEITSVISYSTAVGIEIPPEYLDDSITKNFYSDKYARIILNIDSKSEGDEVFALVESINNNAKDSYGDDAYALGESAVLYDIKESITGDSTKVSLIAIVAILLVIMLSFKSLILPIILVFVIEGAIWINLAVPYFMGSDLNYMGYLIINTVQLGATVDYAIILSDTYVKKRREFTIHEATRLTLMDTVGSIFVSATILASAGLCLNIVSENPIISELGILLCRGTILSAVLVVFALPVLLNIFDKLIAKTTRNSKFVLGGKEK